MNDAVLIQQAYSQSIFAQMMALFYQRHTDYCQMWKLDFWAVQADVTSIPTEFGCWSKVELVKQALEAGYQKVIWLDADAFISNFNVDLRGGCPGGIGACIHNANGIPPHWNVGVLYFDNLPPVHDFMRGWIGLAPGYDGWAEQGIFNNLAVNSRFKGVVKTIDDQWNSTINTNESQHPVVTAFHGVGNPAQRLEYMRQEAKK